MTNGFVFVAQCDPFGKLLCYAILGAIAWVVMVMISYLIQLVDCDLGESHCLLSCNQDHASAVSWDYQEY